MDNNKSMIVVKENFFKKLIKKIQPLLKRHKDKNGIVNLQRDIQGNNLKTKSDKKDTFFDSIKVDVDFEIRALKVKFDNGEIKAIDLTDEQIDKLQAIYDEEIREKKQKIEKLKKSA